MPVAKKITTNKTNNGAGLEQTLWLAADKMRKNIDAAEYKHVVLGLIFLKYISDSFETHHNKLIEGKGDYKGAEGLLKKSGLSDKILYIRWN